MRLSSRVIFITETKSTYNTKTSRTESKSIYHSERPCNVNPLKRERVQAEFGDYSRDISVVRVIGTVTPQPTQALINGRKYKVVDTRYYNGFTSVFVEEVRT